MAGYGAQYNSGKRMELLSQILDGTFNIEAINKEIESNEKEIADIQARNEQLRELIKIYSSLKKLLEKEYQRGFNDGINTKSEKEQKENEKTIQKIVKIDKNNGEKESMAPELLQPQKDSELVHDHEQLWHKDKREEVEVKYPLKEPIGASADSSVEETEEQRNSMYNIYQMPYNSDDDIIDCSGTCHIGEKPEPVIENHIAYELFKDNVSGVDDTETGRKLFTAFGEVFKRYRLSKTACEIVEDAFTLTGNRIQMLIDCESELDVQWTDEERTKTVTELLQSIEQITEGVFAVEFYTEKNKTDDYKFQDVYYRMVIKRPFSSDSANAALQVAYKKAEEVEV